MNFESIISHMNNHHNSNLIDLCSKFAKTQIHNAKLVSVDFNGLDLVYNDTEKLRINFDKEANQESIKNAIIELCMSAKSNTSNTQTSIEQELENFMNSFNSVVLATLSKNNEATSSYAPFIQHEGKNYIYISEVSEHFENIKTNPNNIETMFLEDESKASSIILRKRLRYKTQASFIQRGAEFDAIFDSFEQKVGNQAGLKAVRNMLDFHLVELKFGKGRFVKGFGQAYDIDGLSISHVSGPMPHKKH